MKTGTYHRIRHLSIIFIIAAVLIVSGNLYAAANDGPFQGMSTGLDDQKAVELTVYNVNLGLVKDVRTLDLGVGVRELRFMDVASQIIPTSVYIRSLKEQGSLDILEQNYEYDLLNPSKLLDKYVGKHVKLYTMNPYTEREELVEARVLSSNGDPVFQIGSDITYGHPGRIIFPAVPDDLISKPTLVWLLENSLSSGQEVEASYLTDGINWKSDYVITLNERDDRAALSGWVTIENRSGTVYRNAKLKLVAGDVHRVQTRRELREEMMYAAREAAAEEQFKEDAFFEYHIYTLQRPSTIKNNQTKQISLVSAENIPVSKELVFHGSQHYYRNKYGSMTSNQKIGVFIEFENRKENNLGMPFPKGIVRVYKNDKEQSLQFIGEDTIDHTPKDEKVRIRLGDAFDVVGSRKQTSWEKIAFDTYEAAFEISLRNHKKEDVVVKVIEPVPGDWTMMSSSHPYKKDDAATAVFEIPVKKDEEVTVTYRVRMRF